MDEVKRHKMINCYQLSPSQLEEVYRKYGRPGEIAPGQPATKKRSRLDAALAAMDRRDNRSLTLFNEEAKMESDIT